MHGRARLLSVIVSRLLHQLRALALQTLGSLASAPLSSTLMPHTLWRTHPTLGAAALSPHLQHQVCLFTLQALGLLVLGSFASCSKLTRARSGAADVSPRLQDPASALRPLAAGLEVACHLAACAAAGCGSASVLCRAAAPLCIKHPFKLACMQLSSGRVKQSREGDSGDTNKLKATHLIDAWLPGSLCYGYGATLH